MKYILLLTLISCTIYKTKYKPSNVSEELIKSVIKELTLHKVIFDGYLIDTTIIFYIDKKNNINSYILTPDTLLTLDTDTDKNILLQSSVKKSDIQNALILDSKKLYIESFSFLTLYYTEWQYSDTFVKERVYPKIQDLNKYDKLSFKLCCARGFFVVEKEILNTIYDIGNITDRSHCNDCYNIK